MPTTSKPTRLLAVNFDASRHRHATSACLPLQAARGPRYSATLPPDFADLDPFVKAFLTDVDPFLQEMRLFTGLGNDSKEVRREGRPAEAAGCQAGWLPLEALTAQWEQCLIVAIASSRGSALSTPLHHSRQVTLGGRRYGFFATQGTQGANELHVAEQLSLTPDCPPESTPDTYGRAWVGVCYGERRC